MALKMPGRTAYSMEVAFGVVASQYPQAAFQTVTVDRGKEFACYANLETVHHLKVYFADRILPGNEVLNRPCNCLGWMSANEAFMNELSHLA
ncbi:hypothetical protein ABEX25_29090 [Paenibacillus thiaminolyticus]